MPQGSNRLAIELQDLQVVQVFETHCGRKLRSSASHKQKNANKQAAVVLASWRWESQTQPATAEYQEPVGVPSHLLFRARARA